MKRKIAFVFPGQGSQHVGMGLDLYQKFREVQEIFDKANDILGFPLTKLAFEGPREELQKTENTQPALLATSIAILQLLEKKGNIKPDICAGHSLGEFSAYTCAKTFNFETGIKIVRKRGQLMANASKNSNGAMAAIIGLDDETVSQICKQINNQKNSIVVPANFNCPGQVVISGHKEAVAKASKIAKEKKARMVVELKVSGAFHSPLIKDAEIKFEEYLSNIEIKEPIIPVVSNVYADKVKSFLIKTSLVKQLSSPVLWTKSVLNMIDAGINTFVEIGSGNVLQGLIRKTNKKIDALSVNNIESLYSTIEKCK